MPRCRPPEIASTCTPVQEPAGATCVSDAVMPKYYFHLHNDINAPDEHGQELPDDRAALELALESARDVASASVRHGHLDLRHFIICIDGTGREVGIVTFADAVSVTR
jgi:hypothetical protein